MNQPHPAQDQAGSPLESRYRRLLWTYPSDYRVERSDEIVGTYLDTVDPGRRWPSPHDAVDLLGAGLRERLRGYGALGLVAALPLAATAALNSLVALSVFLLLQVEFEDPRFAGLDSVGPFQTLGAVIWLGWLLVAVAATTLPGNWARSVAAGGLLLTVVVPPVAAATGQPGPPLFVLVPAVALGLATLALPSHPGLGARSLPLLTAGCVTVASVAFSAAEHGGNMFTSYGSTPELLAMFGGLVFALVLLVGLGRALRADDAGLWATVLLATPAALFGANQLSQGIWGSQGGGPTSAAYASTTGTILLVGTALLAAALAGQAARHRTVRRRVLDDACPTCGHRSTASARA